GRKLLLDLTLDLRQRLGAGRVIGLDLDQVPAALALERPDELLYRRREELFVERRLALALGHPLPKAADVLRRGVGRVLLRHLLPGGVARVRAESGLRLVHLGLVLVEDQAHVARLRSLELGDVRV